MAENKRYKNVKIVRETTFKTYDVDRWAKMVVNAMQALGVWDAGYMVTVRLLATSLAVYQKAYLDVMRDGVTVEDITKDTAKIKVNPAEQVRLANLNAIEKYLNKLGLVPAINSKGLPLSALPDTENDSDSKDPILELQRAMQKYDIPVIHQHNRKPEA